MLEHHTHRVLPIVTAALVACVPVLGQDASARAPATEVMLLGVYHFANPGADTFNVEIDDYLQEGRQREIAVVVDRLAQFRPDKIFVERRPSYQAQLDELYTGYRAGERTLEALGPNEIYQIGFRLGHWLEHERLYCGDAHGLWLGSAVRGAAERNSLEFFAQNDARLEQETAEEGVYLRNHTILENLILFNRQESILANHAFYNEICPRVVDSGAREGTPFQDATIDGVEYTMTAIDNYHVGADLVGEWYKRNVRSFGNIVRQVGPDDERILVIIGQGHVRILQHFFGDHPQFALVAPNDYLADGGEEESTGK